MNFLTWTCPSAVKHWIFLQVTFSWGALIIKWHTTVISCDSQTCNTCVRHILRKGAIKIYPTCTDNTEVINVAKLMALYQSRLRSHCSATKKKNVQQHWTWGSPLPALPTETLYVGSPPWLFVRMSIVQSLSIWRLSLITEHFLLPKVSPLVKNPSRSFPINTSISSGWRGNTKSASQLTCTSLPIFV